MPRTRFSSLRQLIRRVLHDPQEGNESDQRLLHRYLTDRDEAAFETILRRHGPMVLDVFRSMLLNEADVEDAFQATFLILAKKAKSIRRQLSLASWLHGVAYRVARKSQTEFARRQRHEGAIVAPTSTKTADNITWREMRQIVHEELGRLPRACREALALCYLEGMTQDTAAKELNIPKGTLKGRLERGRSLLRTRLIRRGLGPTGLLLAGAWPSAAMSAELPATIAAATLNACAGLAAGKELVGLASARIIALVHGFLNALFWKKLKIIGAVVAAIVGVCLGSYGLVVGSSEIRHRLHIEQPQVLKAANPIAEAADDDLWTTSSDNRLALRVSAEPRQAKPTEPTTLTATLRNLTDGPIHVLRPFGRGADSIHMKGLNIREKTAQLRYDGPHDEDRVFAVLQPGETIQDRIVIRNPFEGFKLRGVDIPEVHTITIQYVYDPNQSGLADVWDGTISSKTVYAEILK